MSRISMILLCASLSLVTVWASPETVETPSSLLPAASAPSTEAVELDASDIALLQKAIDPATEQLSVDELARLTSSPEIQKVGWACCIPDCWVAWGVCMDLCPDEEPQGSTCRNACRSARDTCIDNCGQPQF